jgi:diguanylate cyclase (GGDEF)-like protein
MDSGSISTLLAIAILVNVGIMAVIVVQAVRRRRKSRHRAFGSNGASMTNGQQAANDASAMFEVSQERLATDVTGAPGFTGASAVPGMSADTADDDDIVALLSEQSAGSQANDALVAVFAAAQADTVGGDTADDPATGQEPAILTDAATGLDNAFSWARVVDAEKARSERYERPVTIVMAEVDGLDRLADRFGLESADRLIPPVADAFRRNARAADRVARLGHRRFAVILTETDEVRAVNYVERVRAACDRWLEAGAVSCRLSIGWSSPAAGGDLSSAIRRAEERMHREQRRAAPWRPDPIPTGSATPSEA